MLRENSKSNAIELPINRDFSVKKRNRNIKRGHFAKIESHL